MNETDSHIPATLDREQCKGTGSCRRKKGTSFMTAQIIPRPNSHPPRYDAIEVLTIAAGVLLVVAIAFVL
jgi:hypothetical protein